MIDVIGVIFRRITGEVGHPGDDPTPGAEPRLGWHVNVTPDYLTERPELEPYVVTPTLMSRVFAGDDPEAPTMTVALRFESREEAEGLGLKEPEPELIPVDAE